MKNIFGLGLVLIFLLSCETDGLETTQITGTWIEKNFMTDTLVFEDHNRLFNLNRRIEMRNENSLQELNTDIYFYEMKEDSISLKWIFSSYSEGINYYFSIDPINEQLKIGNFFIDSISKNSVLTFERNY